MAWLVGASERRVDGDRVTELVKAKDWLANHNSRGPEVNPLKSDDDAPPALPMYLSRDHLHDRNRQTALFDPAQPGHETYVRVTRRRAPPETEAFLAKQCEERVREWQAQEAQRTSEAFELLELRSMGVRTALEACKQANMQVAAGEWSANQSQAPLDPNEQRASQLHQKLGIDKVVLVSSPMFIDDTPGAGHNTAYQWTPSSAEGSFAPPDGLDAMSEQAAPAAPAPAAKPPTMRGGAWPASDAYFVKKASPPKKLKEGALHMKGMHAPSATRAATRASA